MLTSQILTSLPICANNRVERLQSKLEEDTVHRMLEEWRPYTNIKSSAVALFSSGEFAQSLILLLNLRDASQENLLDAGFNNKTRRTLKDLLVAHMIFSGIGLFVTLLLLALGGVRREIMGQAPTALQKASERFGLTTPGELGWLCKWLNAATMVAAFATAVLSTAIASYRSSPTPLS
jgi:hypothetical protein